MNTSGPAHAETVRDIRDVLAAYAQALDDGRTDDVVATFATDATVVIPGRDILRGRDAIREAYLTMKPQRPQRHIVVNTRVIASDGETAQATSDLLVLVHGSSGWAVRFVGRYTDDLRRDEQTWRFAARTLEFV